MERARDAVAPTLLQVLDEEGTLVGEDPDLGDGDYLRMYRHMLLIRLLDERMTALQRQGRIGFYGPATGEEAAVVGSAYPLERQDWTYPALRQGGAALLRGYPLVKYVAQLMGNGEDTLKGHMQPCHYASRDVNHVSWSSCVGNQLPQAVGTAMAIQHLGDPAVVLAYLGDGGTSTADFHVALNFAGVYAPPVVFLCQNNHWSISVPLAWQTASDGLAVKASAYGLPGVRVDGNDVLAVYAATRDALAAAREGKGATLIEAVTYRMGPHSTADDPTLYREAEEVEAWRARDPIARFRAYLRRRRILDEEKDEGFEEELGGEIAQAIRFAEAAGRPSWESLLEDVYAEEPPHLAEQRAWLAEFME